MNDTNPAAGEKREVHLLDYWRLIWRGRWMVIGIFTIVMTLVAIGTFTQTPVYRSRVTVEITPQSRKLAPVADVSDMGSANFGWFAEERFFNTQYEIIKSRDVAKRVFDSLDLYSHPTFKVMNDPLGTFTRMIQVEPIRDTGIVEISLEGPNPEEVTTWVNTTAKAYVDRNLNMAVEATTSAVKALLSEITPLRERLEDSQQSSFEYAERSNLFVPENQQKITSDRLSTLQGDLTATQIKRAEAESVLKQIDALRDRGESYESLPQVGNDPVVQDLYRQKVALEREYERLLVTFRDKHVRVQEKQSEVENVNAKIKAEGERILSGLRTQLSLLKDQEQKVGRAIEETRSDSLRMNRKASSFALVQGEATEAKRIYDMINTRVKEIELSASLLNNNLRSLDLAFVPKVPVKPRVLLNLVVGAMLGLLLGVGSVFFLDYIDNTIRSSEDVEQFLKLSLLAIVPKDSEATANAVREAYQTLRTSLLFSRKKRTGNILLLTSTGPQEGKSCTTVNLAKTLAAAGERCIILDCDLRRPTIHQRLNVDRDGGVTNYIIATEDGIWRKFVKGTSQANLSVMTCGPIPPNPPEVFGQERFHALLGALREEFDWILIDSPPVVSLSDASILASVSDMVMFVIKHNASDKDLIRRCLANIRKVNPNIIGAVLNNVDLGRSHYKDYYYVGYYYYGESESKKKKKRKETGKVTTLLPGTEEDQDRSVG